jgi:hypothetical protein
MKSIVETTGDHMLIHVKTGESIHAHRPSVAEDDEFLHYQVGLRHLRILARDLPSTVTDAEWAIWLKECDGDMDLAIASFVSSFEKAEPLAEVISVTKKGKK